MGGVDLPGKPFTWWPMSLRQALQRRHRHRWSVRRANFAIGRVVTASSYLTRRPCSRSRGRRDKLAEGKAAEISGYPGILEELEKALTAPSAIWWTPWRASGKSPWVKCRPWP